MVRRSWSLEGVACQGGTPIIGGGLALGTPSKTFTGHGSSIDAFDIPMVFPPSHNVATIRNIVVV